MYVDPFGREHKYPPPENWVTPNGVQSLGPAEWDELCARGLHFEPYTGTDATLCGIRGDCLFPLLEAGRHMIVTRPFREGESLIDGGLYVIAWNDDGEVGAYRARMGLPPDEPIEIVKFLRYIGFEWCSFCRDSSAELNGTITAVVVGVVTIESTPQVEARAVHAFQPFTDRDTGQLGANAASQTIASGGSSTSTIITTTGPQSYNSTVFSLSITTNGGLVSLDAVVGATIAASGAPYLTSMTFTLTRNGVAISGAETWDAKAAYSGSGNNLSQHVTLVCTDAPVAGTYTYGVAVAYTLNAASSNINIGSFFVGELKIREYKR